MHSPLGSPLDVPLDGWAVASGKKGSGWSLSGVSPSEHGNVRVCRCPCSHRKVDLTLPTGALPYAPPPAEEGQVQQLARDGALDVLTVSGSSSSSRTAAEGLSSFPSFGP